jgi:hypothetical protein
MYVLSFFPRALLRLIPNTSFVVEMPTWAGPDGCGRVYQITFLNIILFIAKCLYRITFLDFFALGPHIGIP